MRPLIRYQDYSREEVHDIFDTKPFKRGCGVWGIHGYIELTHDRGNFIFFVTIGAHVAHHSFDEGITSDGVLSWQSQPKQELDDPKIAKLIAHDELRKSIHLFLRTNENCDYTYLGKLKYISHDSERQRPVYFKWQVLDWVINQEQFDRIGLVLKESRDIYVSSKSVGVSDNLVLMDMPRRRERKGSATRVYQQNRRPDYSEIDFKNKRIGDLGEDLVIEYEKKSLSKAGHPELIEKIRHISRYQGDSAGYDIESVTPDGEIKFIEVKSTRGDAQTPFYMSSNEMAFSKDNSKNYYLYRICDLNEASRMGSIFIVQGDVSKSFAATPIQYRMALSSEINEK